MFTVTIKQRLGAIFDGAAFSTKRSQAQFFVKYCIQRPFVEIVTAVIKTWRLLEGVSSPLAEKKGEAEAGALYALRYEVF